MFVLMSPWLKDLPSNNTGDINTDDAMNNNTTTMAWGRALGNKAFKSMANMDAS